MTCPKCRSHHAQPFESWTIVGRKMTIPLLRLWACVNRDCRHQWPRELNSPIDGITSQAYLGDSLPSPQPLPGPGVDAR
jgi:hypothetical protein